MAENHFPSRPRRQNRAAVDFLFRPAQGDVLLNATSNHSAVKLEIVLQSCVRYSGYSHVTQNILPAGQR
jgi:hypothetical protein